MTAGRCHTDGDCCGPGSYCCAHTGPHTHEGDIAVRTDTATGRVLRATAATWPRDETIVAGQKLDAAMRNAGVSTPLASISDHEADGVLTVLERIRSGEIEAFRRANGEFEIRRAPRKPQRKPFKFRGRAE